MKKLRDHTYHYDQLVVGGNIEAVVYSFIRDIPLLFTRQVKPFRFDSFDSGFDLSLFGVVQEDKTLTTRDKEKVIGFYKKDLWERLTFMLSVAGNIPFADKIKSIRFEDEKAIKVITTSARSVKATFNKMYVFDDHGLSNFPCQQKINNKEVKYKVIDWVNVRSGTKHKYDYFKTDDDFVREVYFYPSDRIDGNHPDKKDLVTISYLSEEQRNDVEYSDTYVKFKVLSMMKEAGVKGQSNGRNPRDPTKKAYRSIKLEPSLREIVELAEVDYHDEKNIFFVKEVLEDIIINTKPAKNSYTFRVNEKINKRNR
tara:strand:+ start:174 stop:1109 length:936 start_codon:yes stop_codon:yes gene_type:complete